MSDEPVATVAPIPIINEHARAIGYVCIVWAAMESRADELLARLIAVESEKVMEIISASVELRTKLDMIKTIAFAKKGNSDWFRDVENLVNHIDNTLRPERNRFVHDAWIAQAGEVNRRTRKAEVAKPQAHKRELITFKDTPVTPEKIWGLAEAIRDAEIHFTIYRLQYEELIPPSHPKSQ